VETPTRDQVHPHWQTVVLVVVAVPEAPRPAEVVVTAAADSSLSTGGPESALELVGLVPPHIA
jgi:hypothetical protein